MMNKIQIYYFSGTGNVLSFEGKKLEGKGYVPFLYRNIIVGNNLHLPRLCPLKVTKKPNLDKRVIKINSQIEDIAIKVNNKTRDIKGNNIIGKLFGVTQRSIGKYMKNITLRVSILMKVV